MPTLIWLWGVASSCPWKLRVISQCNWHNLTNMELNEGFSQGIYTLWLFDIQFLDKLLICCLYLLSSLYLYSYLFFIRFKPILHLIVTLKVRLCLLSCCLIFNLFIPKSFVFFLQISFRFNLLIACFSATLSYSNSSVPLPRRCLPNQIWKSSTEWNRKWHSPRCVNRDQHRQYGHGFIIDSKRILLIYPLIS